MRSAAEGRGSAVRKSDIDRRSTLQKRVFCKLMLMCMYERLYSLYTVQYTWRACVICREQQSE